jgi:hypothetical protein
MIEDFLSSCLPLDRSTNQRESLRSEPSGHQTPLSSFADSGVGLSNQYAVPPSQEDVLMAEQVTLPPDIIFDPGQVPALESLFDTHQSDFRNLDLNDITAQHQTLSRQSDFADNQIVFGGLSHGNVTTAPDTSQVANGSWSLPEPQEFDQASFDWRLPWESDATVLSRPVSPAETFSHLQT